MNLSVESNMVRRILFACILGAAVVRSAMCQPGPTGTTSLEVQVLRARTAAVGLLRHYELSTDARSIASADFKIVDTIKGASLKRVTVAVPPENRDFRAWIEGKSRFLLMGGPDHFEFIELDGPSVAVMRKDERVLRDGRSVVRAAREIVREAPAETLVDTFNKHVLSGPLKGFRNTGMGFYQLVPVDRSLELWAHEAVRSKDATERASAARALAHFPSPANIARLRSLLSDPAMSEYSTNGDPHGSRVRRYYVRQAAEQALRAIHAEVGKVTIEETIGPDPKLNFLYIDGRSNADELLRAVVTMPNVTTVYATAIKPTPAVLQAALEARSNLEGITLDSDSIDAGAIAAITKIQGLKRLSLNRSTITDTNIRELAKLPVLEELSIAYTNVTDACVDDLVKIRSLRRLNLVGTSINIDSLKKLGKLPLLRAVDPPIAVWDLPTEFITKMREVGCLRLFPSMFTANANSAAADADITAVALAGKTVDDANIGDVVSLPKLNSLTIDSKNLTVRGFAQIGKVRDMRALMLNDSSLDDAGMQALSGLSELRSLGVAHTRLTSAAFSSIAKLTRLEWMALGGVKVTDSGYAEIAKLPNLKGLVASYSGMTDAALGYVAKMPKLERLLIYFESVTDVGLLRLAECKSLRHIDVQLGNGVTRDGIAKLHRLRPDLEIQL